MSSNSTSTPPPPPEHSVVAHLTAIDPGDVVALTFVTFALSTFAFYAVVINGQRRRQALDPQRADITRNIPLGRNLVLLSLAMSAHVLAVFVSNDHLTERHVLHTLSCGLWDVWLPYVLGMGGFVTLLLQRLFELMSRGFGVREPGAAVSPLVERPWLYRMRSERRNRIIAAVVLVPAVVVALVVTVQGGVRPVAGTCGAHTWAKVLILVWSVYAWIVSVASLAYAFGSGRHVMTLLDERGRIMISMAVGIVVMTAVATLALSNGLWSSAGRAGETSLLSAYYTLVYLALATRRTTPAQDGYSRLLGDPVALEQRVREMRPAEPQTPAEVRADRRWLEEFIKYCQGAADLESTLEEHLTESADVDAAVQDYARQHRLETAFVRPDRPDSTALNTEQSVRDRLAALLRQLQQRRAAAPPEPSTAALLGCLRAIDAWTALEHRFRNAAVDAQEIKWCYESVTAYLAGAAVVNVRAPDSAMPPKEYRPEQDQYRRQVFHPLREYLLDRLLQRYFAGFRGDYYGVYIVLDRFERDTRAQLERAQDALTGRHSAIASALHDP